MSRLDALLVNVLARFGVDPMAGDLAATRTEAPPPFPGSPYACTPTRWGDDEETKAARPRAAPPEAAPPKVPPPAPAVSRRPRRRRLTVRREPVPRGLLLP